MKSKITAIVLCLILFTACNNDQVNTNIPTPLKTLQSTATPIIPTTTLTIKSPQTLSPTISSTRVIPAATQTAISLIEENWQICERAMYPGWNNALSDDGKWLAVECDLNLNNRTFTKVFQLNGTQSWDVPFYETAGVNLKSESFPDGFEAGVMMPFHWSTDGNYLYLAPKILYLDGPWLEFVNGFGLYRLDLYSGKISKSIDANAYAFSPNEKFLAYISQSGNLEILNLFTGEITIKSVASTQIGLGYLMWSPDSQKITFIQALDLLWKQNGQFTIYLYHIENNNLNIILSQDHRSCVVDGWLSDSLIQLGSSYSNECQLIYDVSQKEFMPNLTPTPILYFVFILFQYSQLEVLCKPSGSKIIRSHYAMCRNLANHTKRW